MTIPNYPLPDHVWPNNFRPVSNPYVAKAVADFYSELIAGRAIKRVDPKAPPLAIERQPEKE